MRYNKGLSRIKLTNPRRAQEGKELGNYGAYLALLIMVPRLQDALVMVRIRLFLLLNEFENYILEC